MITINIPNTNEVVKYKPNKQNPIHDQLNPSPDFFRKVLLRKVQWTQRKIDKYGQMFTDLKQVHSLNENTQSKRVLSRYIRIHNQYLEKARDLEKLIKDPTLTNDKYELLCEDIEATSHTLLEELSEIIQVWKTCSIATKGESQEMTITPKKSNSMAPKTKQKEINALLEEKVIVFEREIQRKINKVRQMNDKKQFATIRSMKNSIKEVKCFKNWIKDKAHDVTIRYNITQYREEVIILCRQLEQYLDQTMKRIEKDINTLDFEEKAIAYKFTCNEL